MISPANTNPIVTDRGYRQRQSRVRARRRAGRGRLRSSPHGTHEGQERRTSSTTRPPYGQGVAEFFKADAEKKGIKVVGFEGTEEKSNFDRDPHAHQGQEPRRHLLRRHLRPGARRSSSRRARRASRPSSWARRHGLLRPDQDRRQGGGRHALHLGGRPGLGAIRRPRQFADEYKKKFGKNPEPLRGRRPTTPPPSRSRPSRPPPRSGKVADARTSSTRRPQRQAHRDHRRASEFDAKGDRQEGAVLRAARSPATTRRSGATTRSSSSSPSRAARPRSSSRPGRVSGQPGRPLALPSLTSPHPAALGDSPVMDFELLIGIFPQVLLDGIIAGLHVRAHRARLHDGLRRARVHQLRALRDLRAGRLRGRRDPAARRSRRGWLERGRPGSSCSLVVLVAACWPAACWR